MSKDIEVSVCRAVLTMGASQIRLTIKVAKQFPIHLHLRREKARAREVVVLPICKVMHKTLDRASDSQSWLYLVDEPKEGMYWAFPNTYDEGGEWDSRVRAKGEFVDEPHKVPTVVL